MTNGEIRRTSLDGGRDWCVGSGGYESANSKFTGEIESVTIAMSPSKMTAAEQKAVGDVGEAADKATIKTAWTK